MVARSDAREVANRARLSSVSVFVQCFDDANAIAKSSSELQQYRGDGLGLYAPNALGSERRLFIEQSARASSIQCLLLIVRFASIHGQFAAAVRRSVEEGSATPAALLLTANAVQLRAQGICVRSPNVNRLPSPYESVITIFDGVVVTGWTASSDAICMSQPQARIFECHEVALFRTLYLRSLIGRVNTRFIGSPNQEGIIESVPRLGNSGLEPFPTLFGRSL